MVGITLVNSGVFATTQATKQKYLNSISTTEEGDKNGFKKCLGSNHKGKHKIQLEWRMRMDGGSSSNPIRSGAERGGEAGNGRDLIHIGIMASSQAAACSRI